MHNDSGSSCPAFSVTDLSDRRTLAEALADGAARFGDAPLTIHSARHGGVATLASLHRQSQALAGALHAYGIRQGDVVAMQLPNWFEQALLIRAVAMLGGVLLPFDDLCPPAQVGMLLRDARAKALVIPDQWEGTGYLDRLAGLGALPALQKLVVIGNDAPVGAMRWTDLLRQATPHFPAPSHTADEVAVLIAAASSTPGETAQLTMHALRAAHHAGGFMRESTGPMLSIAPAGSLDGLLAQLRHAWHGTPTLMLEQWDPVEAALAVERQRVAAVSGPPARFGALLDAAAAEGNDIGSLRAYASLAQALPPALAERCRQLGVLVTAPGADASA